MKSLICLLIAAPLAFCYPVHAHHKANHTKGYNPFAVVEAKKKDDEKPAPGSRNDGIQNQATINHPNIQANNGPGSAACPHADKDHCNNMHGIANNPGQSGRNPNDDGVKGNANELGNTHGGIGDVNKNVD